MSRLTTPRAALALIALFLTGCMFEYPVVGAFDNHKDIFRGTVYHDALNGTSQIKVTAEPSGVKGQGNSWVTYIPFMSNGAGQRGRANLSFGDGRMVRAEWTATSLTSGYGRGFDQFGHTFQFTFGMSEEEASSYVDALKRDKTDQPSLPPVYRPKETRKEKGYATGTGFFISKNGHIVTNFHVIEDASDISVVTDEGQTLQATVITSDQANDVAILKVNKDTKGLRLSAKVEKGDEVLTVGYPQISIQGRESKVTFGNVNALSGIKGDVRYVQIDVPIQPGNSGGPLVNDRAEVVGIVTATLNAVAELRANGTLPQNVNYAVKSDYIAPLIKDIQKADTPPSIQLKRKEIVSIVNKEVVLVIAK